mgnify:CR=1 FL=1
MTMDEIIVACCLLGIAIYGYLAIMGASSPNVSSDWVSTPPPPESHFSHCWEKPYPTFIVCE